MVRVLILYLRGGSVGGGSKRSIRVERRHGGRQGWTVRNGRRRSLRARSFLLVEIAVAIRLVGLAAKSPTPRQKIVSFVIRHLIRRVKVSIILENKQDTIYKIMTSGFCLRDPCVKCYKARTGEENEESPHL